MDMNKYLELAKNVYGFYDIHSHSYRVNTGLPHVGASLQSALEVGKEISTTDEWLKVLGYEYHEPLTSFTLSDYLDSLNSPVKTSKTRMAEIIHDIRTNSSSLTDVVRPPQAGSQIDSLFSSTVSRVSMTKINGLMFRKSTVYYAVQHCLGRF